MLNKLNSLRDREDGFTLIELLIVVIIIGILAAIALPIFINQQKVAVDASVKSDVRNTVTNVTNMQAQRDASSFKLARSGDNTVEVRVNGSVVAAAKGSNDARGVDKTLASADTLALGTAYTVDGYNAGGKVYQGPGVTGGKNYVFSSATGQFSADSIDAASAAPVATTSFEGGETIAFKDYRTSSTVVNTAGGARTGSYYLSVDEASSNVYFAVTPNAGTLVSGKSYVLSFYSRTAVTNGNNYYNVYVSGNSTTSLNLSNGTTWKKYNVPFVFNGSREIGFQPTSGTGVVRSFDDFSISPA